MTDGRLDEVRLGVERASRMYHRLLVVAGNDEVDAGRRVAEGLGIPRVALGEKLAEKLLEVPIKSRPLRVADLLGNLLDEVEDGGVVLDRIEILFEKSLKAEPLTLLNGVSRRRLVVAMWRGESRAGNLVYGVHGHPEYRSYPARDVNLVRFP